VNLRGAGGSRSSEKPGPFCAEVRKNRSHGFPSGVYLNATAIASTKDVIEGRCEERPFLRIRNRLFSLREISSNLGLSVAGHTRTPTKAVRLRSARMTYFLSPNNSSIRELTLFRSHGHYCASKSWLQADLLLYLYFPYFPS
jgi:hypothetical protein